MDTQVDRWIHRQIDEYTDRQMNSTQIDRQTGRQGMNACKDWYDDLMECRFEVNRQIDSRIDRQIDRQIDRYLDIHICTYTYIYRQYTNN